MKDPDFVAAVDPGVSGGLALGPVDGTPVLYKFAEPVVRKALREAFFNGEDIYPFMEHVHASPIMNVSTAFTFGDNFGWWRRELVTYNEVIELVRPQTWMKPYARQLIELRKPGMKPDQIKRARKNFFKAEGKRLYPDIKGLTLDTSDALLIFHHAVQKLNTKGTT